MRTLSSWSTLPLVFLLAVVVGCSGGDDASSAGVDSDTERAGGGSFGAAGEGGGQNEDPHDGGESGSGGAFGAVGGGTAGSANGPPGAGAAGAGGAEIPPEATVQDDDGCVGKFQEGAPWPAAGRCSARQGNAPAPGPTKFGGVNDIELAGAIAASPVVDAAGNVYVVHAKGLTKLDALLFEKTEIYTGGAISSAPVITDKNRVIFLTEKGELLGVAVNETKPTPINFEREPNEATSGWKSSLALDALGRVVFASPNGNVYIVDPTLVLTDSTPLGAEVTGSSIAISTQGDLAVGTNKGLFILPHGQTTSKKIPILGAPVSRTAVFIPKAGKSEITAIYADDKGIVHNVVVDASGDAVDTPSKGEPPLGLSPGAPAVLSGPVAKIFLGDGPLLRLLDTSDGPAIVDSKTIALQAAGPIVGAPATDILGQLFVPSTDGSIYRLTQDPNDAAAFVTGDSFLTEGSITAAPALAGKKLYFGSSDKKLYVITEQPIPGAKPLPEGK